MSCQPSTLKNETENIVIGSKENARNSFVGDLGDINIWTFALEEALSWTQCKLMMNGDYLNWSNADVTLFDTQANFESKETLCKNFHPYTIELGAIPYDVADLICRQLGTQLHLAFANMEFDGTIWTGYTNRREEAKFVNSAGESINGSFWDANDQKQDVSQNCLVFNRNTMKMFSADCDYSYKAVCWFKKPPTLKLRGFDRQTILVDDTYYYNYEKELYEGVDRSVIKYIEKQWIIYDRIENKTIIHTYEGALGKQRWYESYWPNTDMELSLDVCNETEFNCNDAICIDINKRCDKTIDCEDQSDEEDCSFIKFPSSYNKNKIPLPIPDSSKRQKYFVLEIVNFSLHIAEIEDSRSIISVQFGIYTKWRDSSLRFQNLKKYSSNSLTKMEYDDLWTPRFVGYKVTMDGLIEEFGSKNVILVPKGESTPSGTHEQHNSLIFEGEDVDIISRNWYTTNIICTFDKLSNFPFDTNTCKFSLYLAGSESAWGYATEYMLKKSFLATVTPRQLELYEVRDVRTEIRNGTARMDVLIVLGRNFLGIFLQYCLPNMLLSVIVYSSNLYYKDMIEIAISMNVTILLAMSGLFIAVYQSLPKTASVKIMDLYQIKCLMIAILITLMQTIHLYLRKRMFIVQDAKKMWKEKNKRGACIFYTIR